MLQQLCIVIGVWRRRGNDADGETAVMRSPTAAAAIAVRCVEA